MEHGEAPTAREIARTVGLSSTSPVACQLQGLQGHASPVWRIQYPPTGREGHPPVAVVFNPGTRAGPKALTNRPHQPCRHDAWYAREEQRRLQREKAKGRHQQEWAAEKERWAQQPPAPNSRRASDADCRAPASPATAMSSPCPRTAVTVPPVGPTPASSTRPCARSTSGRGAGNGQHNATLPGQG
ncbi:LexA family protein [Streptomyces avermitilis]|uniref:LexA family protein n=1 Tax=Streptomyces avermitilis TaxID=33903 RepID=UPI0036B1ECD3